MNRSQPFTRRTRGLLAGLTAAALALGGVAVSGAPAVADEVGAAPVVDSVVPSAEAAADEVAEPASAVTEPAAPVTPAPATGDATAPASPPARRRVLMPRPLMLRPQFPAPLL